MNLFTNPSKFFSLLSTLYSLLCLLLTGCSFNPYHTESRLLMGTIVEITCQDRSAIGAAFEEIKRIEKIANKFDTASEISLLNEKGEIKASEDLLNLVRESLNIYRLSEGAFDITINPVASIWKEEIKKADSKKSEVALPAAEEIREKLSLVGSDKIVIDETQSLIKFIQPGVSIDLGGIAKGYAVDAAVKRLKELGITSALVNAGGNIYCMGRKNNRKWHIGIQDPRRPQKISYYLDLENQGAATSGDYQQFFVSAGKRYSHIIDPKTGYPVDNGIISVTIIAPNAALADGLSTAVFVLGIEKGIALVKKLGNNIGAKIIEEGEIKP